MTTPPLLAHMGTPDSEGNLFRLGTAALDRRADAGRRTL